MEGNPTSPPSHSLENQGACVPDSISIQNSSPRPFVQGLLEHVLSTATSRSPLYPSSEDHYLPRSTSNNASRPSTHLQGDSSSTSDTDSSNSDSENTRTLLTTPLGEPDVETDRDIPMRTKNEQDESKIYISRPDFVTTAEHTLVRVGTISAVLEDAVVVSTFNLTEPPRQLSDADISNATALDTGSLLCFSDGTVLGAVYETFGPVSSPLYIVRFNNSDEIPTATRVGAEVKYVEQEMCLVRCRDVRGKGYDASGKDDEEAEAEEFSDDEMERRARRMKRGGTPNRPGSSQKRARSYGEGYEYGQSDRGGRRKGGYRNERERYQHHEDERTWTAGPTERGRHRNLREYNSGPFPYYHSGTSSSHQPQPHPIVPDPSFPSGRFGSHVPSAPTMSTYYASRVPLSMPTPLMAASRIPGPPHSAMLQSGVYSSQPPPSAFPQMIPPFGSSPTATAQPPFLWPGQNFSAHMNSSDVMQNNAYRASSHQAHNMMQTETEQVPRMRPPQLHHLQQPYVWRGERNLN